MHVHILNLCMHVHIRVISLYKNSHNYLLLIINCRK
jgi:hypothetical protein